MTGAVGALCHRCRKWDVTGNIGGVMLPDIAGTVGGVSQVS